MACSDADSEFTWGKSEGTVDEEKKYYSSFFYQGEEYSLFDNVVVYDEQSDGHVAKIMKLWEDTSTGAEKTLLRWFIRPEELPPHLRAHALSASRQKELFLAFGHGKGVCNENYLDCIMRKCKVLCTSKDIRNKQPSEEDLRDAEYIFSKIYNVDCKKLLNVEGIVKMLGKDAIFNKTEWLNDKRPLKQDSDGVRNRPMPEISKQLDSAKKGGYVEDSGNVLSLEPSLPVAKSTRNDTFISSTTKEILPGLGARLQDLDINIEENLHLGKVLLLRNLDPSFTTADLHALVRYAFEGCLIGQMLYPFSSTNVCSVDALLVFKTTELANSALRTLEEECLVLTGSNRVLIGWKVASPEQGTISRFLGHFPLDIFELKKLSEDEKMSRTPENFDASHFSEHNTVEYEMAMDWKMLQSKICSCWNQLCKVQEEELKALLSRHKHPCDSHRYRIKCHTYPAILPLKGGRVSRKVFLDITDKELDVLGDFEDIDYKRRTLESILMNGC